MGPEIFEYYAAPGRHTTLDEFPLSSTDIHAIVTAVQGLLIDDTVAQPFYGVELTPEQAEVIHERDSAPLLALARALDPRPLDQPRTPANRVGARCHSYSRLTVALLRTAGVPARARCGFGGYFQPGWLEDHWVAEFWNEAENRWQVVDPSLDATWQTMIGFGGNLYDLTTSEFVTAGHAWRAWRSGNLEADRCGLSSVDEHGAHWIAGNLRLDLASLNKVEMLPWDVWGAGWQPGSQPTDDLLACFDTAAALTVEPETNFAGLRHRYDSDESLRMDGTVFNALRGKFETVS